MMNVKTLYVLEKNHSQNLYGEVTEYYEEIGSVNTSHLLPIKDLNMIQAYGFDPYKTFELYTVDVIKENTYLKDNGTIFHVRLVEEYPSHKRILVEVV